MLKVKFKSNANCVKEENVDTKEENACDWKKKKGEIPEKVTLTKNFTLLGISQHWVHKGYNVQSWFKHRKDYDNLPKCREVTPTIS